MILSFLRRQWAHAAVCLCCAGNKIRDFYVCVLIPKAIFIGLKVAIDAVCGVIRLVVEAAVMDLQFLKLIF